VRVLFLTHAFPRTRDDLAGSFILRLALALSREQIAVDVVAPHAPGLAVRDTIEGIRVRRFRYAPEAYETLAYAGTMAEQVRTSWSARLALTALVAGAMYDADRARVATGARLVHAHWWFPSGLAAAGVASFRKLPLVTTLHGSDVRLARSVGPARALYARVAARSDVVTAVSGWLATEARALAPRSAAPTVAPMPADVQRFSPAGDRARDRLLFVGRLLPQKGVEYALRALVALPPEVSLDVVGDGPDSERLRRIVASLGLSARVRWHGAMPQARLVDFYRAATALVVPSVDEGLGLVAVEAQLCETPVVAFDSGGLRDVVVDGETGVLVPSVNSETLAAALRALLARPDQGASFGRAARAAALARFAPDAVGRRYAAVYRDAINHFVNRQV
jgi:glycosyltransferase involved in cell wall biosynthesis